MNTKYLFVMLIIAVFLIGFKVSIADTATGSTTISNAAPSVGTTTLFNQAGADAAITLTAGATVTVFCNTTLTDTNGYEDLDNATATLYHSSSSSGAADDENVHYTNSSCSIGTNTSTTVAPATCYFTLDYMTTNGTWTCNVTTNDGTATASATDTNTVNTLAALDVSESTLNFGTMSLGANSTSANTTTIQNLGNIIIDAQVNGSTYSCTTAGTIPVGNTRYNVTNGNYDALLKVLTTTATTQSALDLGVRGVATADGTNSTKVDYWGILIPSTGIGGTCTNTLTVAAIAN